jgi:hypothetical protein
MKAHFRVNKSGFKYIASCIIQQQLSFFFIKTFNYCLSISLINIQYLKNLNEINTNNELQLQWHKCM